MLFVSSIIRRSTVPATLSVSLCTTTSLAMILLPWSVIVLWNSLICFTKVLKLSSVSIKVDPSSATYSAYGLGSPAITSRAMVSRFVPIAAPFVSAVVSSVMGGLTTPVTRSY